MKKKAQTPLGYTWLRSSSLNLEHLISSNPLHHGVHLHMDMASYQHFAPTVRTQHSPLLIRSMGSKTINGAGWLSLGLGHHLLGLGCGWQQLNQIHWDVGNWTFGLVRIVHILLSNKKVTGGLDWISGRVSSGSAWVGSCIVAACHQAQIPLSCPARRPCDMFKAKQIKLLKQRSIKYRAKSPGERTLSTAAPGKQTWTWWLPLIKK